VFAGGVALKGFDFLLGKIGDTIDFANESIEAFSAQEDAVNKLGQALRASGDFSQQALSDLTAFSSELGRTSKFGDEVIVSQLAMAKAFGASNKEAKDLVQAAANLSATFGGSLEENVQKLGKSLTGELGRLGQFIPELKNLTEAQLQAGAAAEIINSKFGGAAASELQTYSGSVIAAKNAFSDLQEEIGALIVDSFNLREKNVLLADVYNLITQAVSDYNIESRRADGSLQENAQSVEQLTRKYKELSVEAIELEQKLLRPGMNMDQTAIFIAKKQLKELNAEIAATKATLDAASRQGADQEQVKEKEKSSVIEQAQIDRRAALNAELVALDKKLALDQQVIAEEVRLAKAEKDEIDQQVAIENQLAFAQQQNQIAYETELAKNALIKDAQDRALADQKAYLNKRIADQRAEGKAEADLAKQQVALDRATVQARADILSGFTNLASTVAKDGTKEQFLIQKAGAIAQAIIATNLAATQALAIPPSPNLPLSALAKASGALNIATIAATAIKGYANGGFIGGETGATRGPDNAIATVRTGELVLNAEQQRNLLDIINNGSSGGGDIVIQIDGREIARAVREQVKQGFRLTA
jgi:hypothetical protein